MTPSASTHIAPGPFTRLYRRLYWLPRDWLLRRPLAGIRTVVAFGESPGDNLLCTPLLAGLHASGAGPLAMLTPFPELFANLPFPVQCLPFDPALLSSLQRGGPRLILANYGYFDPALDRHVPPPRDHLIVEMCRNAGLHGTVELKPLLSLTSAERSAGAARTEGHILIQTSSRGGRLSSLNKEWPAERWQRVADELKPHHTLTQIGSREDPLLAGVRDLRGQLTLREVAACLSAARLFVGGEGLLMHLGRAVDCRAVIVLGGRTAPQQTCYAENANLFTAVPCAPCWQRNTCDYGRECLQRITPADVLAAVTAQLALPRLSGPAQRVTI
jgi:ADP-heptose:LPS heptosyltransferase